MLDRELKTAVQARYFKTDTSSPSTPEEGTRELAPLYPFVVSGGENTERYYFKYVTELSKYKFNVRPEYFGNESAYTEVFPSIIEGILSKNAGAKVFCVFDMDTIVNNDQEEVKHQAFLNGLAQEIANGQVVICDSMPTFEFWLLLHFRDYEGLLKNYTEVSKVLAPYIKPCFANPTIRLKKLLKSEKYLKDSTWVKNLLKDDKLEQAIDRAKVCAQRIESGSKAQSYSNVFKAFE